MTITEACPICGGCNADNRQLRTLNDLEEACKLLTGLLDAFDNRWTGEKPPPPIYYRAEHFLDRMLPARLSRRVPGEEECKRFRHDEHCGHD